MALLGNPHVADSVNQALAAGMSESTVESQHIRAIAILTAQAAAATDGSGAALTAAVALLNKSLSHIRDPKNNNL